MDLEGFNFEVSASSIEVDLWGWRLQYFNEEWSANLLVSNVCGQVRSEGEVVVDEIEYNVLVESGLVEYSNEESW